MKDNLKAVAVVLFVLAVAFSVIAAFGFMIIKIIQEIKS